MTRWSLPVQVLLLSLQAVALLHTVTQGCSQLRIPPANVEYALLHIDSFNAVEDMGNIACESFRVPKYKCSSVKKEILDTMTEMAQLAIREAVVNVSLDRSLVYDVWIVDEATGEPVKAPEPIVIYPEQPLADTMLEYCRHFKLDNQSCERGVAGISDLLARDWGCNDQIDEAKEFVEIPVILDQQKYQIKLDVSNNGAVDAVRFCMEKNFDTEACAIFMRAVREQVQAKHAKHDDSHRDDKAHKNTGGRRRLRVNSPSNTRLYPSADRIYVKVDWEQDVQGPDEDIVSEEICLHVDYLTEPETCFQVPQTDPLFFNRNTQEGYHVIHFTSRNGEILAATTFQVVIPTVNLDEISTAAVEASGNTSRYLVATIRTTHFNLFDPEFRVCVLLDDSFDCLDSEWMTLGENDEESTDQSVTFQALVDHVPFNGPNDHRITLLLLTRNNKAVYLSHTTTFRAPPTINPPSITSRLHVLDPRLHTPQRPKVCPMQLLSTDLRWICELWRHEWGAYSQNGEDGIIHSIFHNIGTKGKSYVEFGTENGQECNTRLLREVHHWTGLLMDSRFEDESIELHREFITRENFMPLLTEKYSKLVPRDLDLLSIDVDFNDFWLLSAVDLTRVSPRVVVVEVNSHIPASEARTVKYDDSDDGSGGWDGWSSYFGGSVAAFHRWGALNGYSMLYCESHGVNCFLVRNDVLGGVNVSALLDPEQLQAPPNFFGQGWEYPDVWRPHHKWAWV
ncbi:hypothetical protein P3T76_008544 [Phytophthora citrophthora]|uniref:Uncharacterized protein n=1 Tax=Phytophthora citrophthora TaxID=4793 RepID=A0AAD9GII3_9STRA|nr:hypothetical protein P3T76_008544 [Phytophthora citrophthora]